VPAKIFDNIFLYNHFQEVDWDNNNENEYSLHEDCWNYCVKNKNCVVSVQVCKRCFLYDKNFKFHHKTGLKAYSKIDLLKSKRGYYH
jgi:hypothetical protein